MSDLPVNKPYASMEDEQLLIAYKQSGSLEVLAILYKRYMGLVYGVCLKFLKRPTDSEDAVMDIFEQLIRKVQQHDIQHFKSWLHVVARNHCLMLLRSRKKHSVEHFEESFMYSSTNHHPTGVTAMDNGWLESEAGLKEGQLQSMEKCLETLVEEQQTSVRLFYLEQKCYKEVAELTGYRLDKVRSYIQNGRRNLKICMEKK